MRANGSVVPDGYYNIQFKIYEGGAGNTAGNPGGSLKWTENYVNNNSNSGVRVKNGYLSVNLGSVNPFGSSVNWDHDTLWLSMNIAGMSADCTSFGAAPCVADGEMLPMKRITATPYSINSGAVGGKTANELVQLGQGAQTDSSSGSSIHINKTGAGNLIQLQAGGTDAFTINNTGSISLGSSADQSISVGSSSSGAGKSLTVAAGGAGSGSNLGGGDLILQAGAGDGAGSSGSVAVKSNGYDSASAFIVQNAANETVFSVDTLNNSIAIGDLKLSSSGSTGLGAAVSLWGNIPTTGTTSTNEGPVNLGLTFKSDVAGQVSGVKFYNPAGGNAGGNDIGKLWECNSANCNPALGGTELASVNFPADTTEGWKTASFSEPVQIQADKYYMVTYFTSTGYFRAHAFYFLGNDQHSAPLHAMNIDTTVNGTYALGEAAFPSETYQARNYWVDVMFQPESTTDEISSDNNLSITSGGSMTIGPSSHELKLQGSEINITANAGGNVTIQGGEATSGNTAGGSLILSGGSSNGTGVDGLVVISTPTFSTTTNDAGCYTGGALVAASCTISQSTTDNSAAAVVGFSAADQIATLPDPTIKMAGRIFYVMAAAGSQDFTLSLNGGSTAIAMSQNSAVNLIWNGSDWLNTSAPGASMLQGALYTPPDEGVGSNLTLGSLDSGEQTNITTVQSTDQLETDTETMVTGDTTPSFDDSPAPSGTENDAPLGSMYYDTSLGELQCFEAEGWGACGDRPDTFITISPEYSGAVMNGADIGTITSDLCSDSLNINDGSDDQPDICGENETYNFYKWTSAENDAQTRSIFVTHQLPANFDKFVAESTSLVGRTDSDDASVSYQIYHDSENGLAPCGPSIDVSSGKKSSWQKVTAKDSGDPSACDFAPGDSILFRINLSAAKNANAYVSNLSFVYSNK